MAVPFEPFQYNDTWQDNEIVGFDVDMMELVAEELGSTLQVVEVDFAEIDSAQALDDGKCDVAASAVSITPERERKMDFSDAYYDNALALAVLPDSPLTGIEDMEGHVLAAIAGTTSAEFAESHAPRHRYEVETVDGPAMLREKLLFDDDVDAALSDMPLWNSEAGEGRLEILESFDTGEQYAYAVATGETELLETINSVISESQENGEFAAIYEHWIEEEYEDG